ncbi:MAG: SLC13 family permease [Candidatus Heimdallarchaeaceae archaeon]
MIEIIASQILISLFFIAVIVLIFSDKLNRAVASLTAAVATYFVLIFIEKKDFSVIVDLLFGTPADGFVNLHSLILILGMMFIVQISAEVGLFQFLGILAIKISKGKPIALMSILCTISVLFSAVINNILTVMIMVPLTITISRILKIDPTPYILTEAILVNIGGTFFSISSIPNILITTSAEITFAEYFLNVGLFSLAVAGITILYFIFMYKKDFNKPGRRLVDTLDEFNVWNFVQSKKLLYASMASIGLLMIGFILIGPVIPAEAVPPDVFAFTVAMILTIFSAIFGLKPKEIIKSFDLELILYLLGIFVLAGALETVGIIALLGNMLAGISSINPTFQIIVLVWISAFLSSLIDNIPITKVLIPLVNVMQTDASVFYGLSVGANWGDNLTPLGDNILVLNLAEQHNRPIKMITFWKLGFTTTLLQLYLGTAYFTFFSIDTYYIGLIMIFAVLLTIGILFIISRFGTEQAKSNISRGINRFRSLIIS